MSWETEYLPEAKKDLKKLDGVNRKIVLKAIKKVQSNPLSIYEGGYGKPLGNHQSTKLSGFLKIKIKNSGHRIVYKIEKSEQSMTIIVIGVRVDEEVYKIAQKRIIKHNL